LYMRYSKFDTNIFASMKAIIWFMEYTKMLVKIRIRGGMSNVQNFVSSLERVNAP
jgi:hypothetical protein